MAGWNRSTASRRLSRDQARRIGLGLEVRLGRPGWRYRVRVWREWGTITIYDPRGEVVGTWALEAFAAPRGGGWLLRPAGEWPSEVRRLLLGDGG